MGTVMRLMTFPLDAGELDAEEPELDDEELERLLDVLLLLLVDVMVLRRLAPG